MGLSLFLCMTHLLNMLLLLCWWSYKENHILWYDHIIRCGIFIRCDFIQWFIMLISSFASFQRIHRVEISEDGQNKWFNDLKIMNNNLKSYSMAGFGSVIWVLCVALSPLCRWLWRQRTEVSRLLRVRTRRPVTVICGHVWLRPPVHVSQPWCCCGGAPV